MTNDLTHFRLECVNCTKHQDLPMNISLQRLELESLAFFNDHAPKKAGCLKEHLFIRTYAAGMLFPSVATTVAKVVEHHHQKLYGASNNKKNS